MIKKVERKKFSDSHADQVWVHQFGNKQYANDVTGRTLTRNLHGSEWDVDHKKPIALGGSDDLSNLQILHQEENSAKGDSYPRWQDTKGAWHRE